MLYIPTGKLHLHGHLRSPSRRRSQLNLKIQVYTDAIYNNSILNEPLPFLKRGKMNAVFFEDSFKISFHSA